MSKKFKHDKRKNKRGLFHRGLVRLAAFAAVIGCGGLIAVTLKDSAEKEQQLENIQTRIDAYETENAELQRVLDSDDLNEYMEKVALEERDYAYSDERRFYDTTRD